MSSNKNSNDGGLGCAFILMMCTLAMPFVGIYLATSGKSKGERMLGVALFVVGIIVWVKIEMVS